MKTAVFAYSRKGCETAKKVRECLSSTEGPFVAEGAAATPGSSDRELRMYAVKRICGDGFAPIRKPSLPFYGELFDWADAMIFVGASGIATREIAPHVKDKKSDPAVIVIDERGKYVIPVLSGHIGGGNALARLLSEKLGSIPVITTATDIGGRFSVDAWAAENGFLIDDMSVAKAVSARILEEDVPLCSEFPITTALPAGVFVAETGGSGENEATGDTCKSRETREPGKTHDPGIYIGYRLRNPFDTTLHLIPKALQIGIGCRRGTSADEIRKCVELCFDQNGLDLRAVCSAASIDLKAEERGLLEYCAGQDWPLEFYSAEELNAVPGEFTKSDFVRDVTGVDNVCERAAMAGAERLIVPKTAMNGVTVAVAVRKMEVRFGAAPAGQQECAEAVPTGQQEHTTAASDSQRHNSGKLYVVGIGPGNYENMTVKADRALRACDVIIGYTVYVDLVRKWYPDKQYLSTGMTMETERCKMALEIAGSGKTVGMVCSGDSGIYGMAALIYELRGDVPTPEVEERVIPTPEVGERVISTPEVEVIEVEVIPGLTAACSGAALLGAPLTHDFAVISLSDRLTPWEMIGKRLAAAAAADLSIVLYNPASKGRPDHLRRACDILLAHLPKNRPCGIARKIGRDGEETQLMTLAELRDAEVDMFCTIFIGNRATKEIAGKMITPRGYRDV